MIGVAGLLVQLALIVLVVLGIRKLLSRERGGVSDGRAVRRFFQYALLYALLVVVAIGLSGLLGRLLEQRALASADDTALARDLAFTVVGIPLCAGVAIWSRRQLAADPSEVVSFGWAFYVTASCLTSLAVAMVGLHDALAWAVGLASEGGRALARFIVWGTVWGVHWWLHLRRVPREHSRLHHVGGSLIGLGTAATGLGALTAGALAAALFPVGEDLLADSGNRALRGAITLLVGVPVWVVYWLRTLARSERDPLWLGYVLLAGVGGGLVTAIVSASTLFYDLLVWVVGDPRAQQAPVHFRGVPSAAAATVVGALVWWYHQAVLEEARLRERTEVRRIYEYLMSGIGLVAAAVGLTMLLVAAIEAVTGPEAVIAGASAVNTLLAAATVLVVGAPLWWYHWHRIQAAAQTAAMEEHASPTRRLYLYGLFGLGGVVAVVALLTGVYLFFEDVVAGTLGSQTLYSMRVSIGVLVTTGAIAAYHWSVYAGERTEPRPGAVAPGPRYVLLVGPADPATARAVARQTGGQVQILARTDDHIAPWAVDDVMAVLAGTTEQEVLVLSDAGGLRVIPVRRS